MYGVDESFFDFFCCSIFFLGDVYGKDSSHKVVLHIDNNDSKSMNIILNNAANIEAYFKSKGQEVKIEIVAYGPGVIMMHAGKSPVKKPI